ncbi:AraC family transcriptional regulator [Bradyrhizobium sp. UASWS1016]|jgi:AraC-like DNA-binding protein|nr:MULTISPECIES: AraC family transcriptional regulator [Bradyrhizobium]KIU50814.1 AraC family transcriptional regulator [Bradyrhizobium elkanii]MBK5654625.1 AraC family transcriptional regulator [Rhizobium sp.]OCX32823.1 AraC family transcriptional regulator [Bradyrhizobium sp. UASWS1016]
MAEPAAPVEFDFVRRPPSPRMAGMIVGITGYRETVAGRFVHCQTAPLIVPFIVSFGSPYLIALARRPEASDRQLSFAAGLHTGPVYIESDGRAESVQVDFTPLGAYRFFGGTITELAGRMVDLGDVLGHEGRRLRERLGNTTCWQRRFDLIEDFVLRRANHAPSPEIASAYRRLARSAGRIRITTLAADIGWSRKHLVDRFRSELGLAPKSLARMMRFHQACRIAQRGGPRAWAAIAAETGYADQAHLVREFVEFAGEPPTAWARRLAMTDSRLAHSGDLLADR